MIIGRFSGYAGWVKAVLRVTDDGAIRSLCYGDQPGMQMTYVASSGRLIVVSERTNIEEEWKPLRSGGS
ncbi:MAG: hypothetical protein QXX56_04220 [Candidatus Bathyarchaeia archaeon]